MLLTTTCHMRPKNVSPEVSNALNFVTRDDFRHGFHDGFHHDFSGPFRMWLSNTVHGVVVGSDIYIG